MPPKYKNNSVDRNLKILSSEWSIATIAFFFFFFEFFFSLENLNITNIHGIQDNITNQPLCVTFLKYPTYPSSPFPPKILFSLLFTLLLNFTRIKLFSFLFSYCRILVYLWPAGNPVHMNWVIEMVSPQTCYIILWGQCRNTIK